MNELILPLLGGIIIGVSTLIMLSFLGRIAGISGILSSIISKPSSDKNWRYTFIFGLVLGGVALSNIRPELFNYNFDLPIIPTIIAGLLVGYGTMLGSGCTSGHGVCGISRFSKRSIVATILFISSGIATVFIKGVL